MHYKSGTPEERLKLIQESIRKNDELIYLNGKFKLTKSEFTEASACLIRDRRLEQSTVSWLNERACLDQLMKRYQSYDPQLKDLTWPAHFAMKVLSGAGAMTSGSNIFMFFPNVLGLKGHQVEDYFGFELIDIWENILRAALLPCLQRVGSFELQRKMAIGVFANIQRAVYLSSIFHEIGHRVGPWRVSPLSDERLQISPFQFDVLGELATDALLVTRLIEFPEVLQFVILQRIFWFGRRGFRDNPSSANLNTDNDCWIGAYLWNKLVRARAIQWDQYLSIDFSLASQSFHEILAEIDDLAQQVRVGGSSADQQAAVFQWMQRSVPHDGKRFLLPSELKQIFFRCLDVPEVPMFLPLVRSFSAESGSSL